MRREGSALTSPIKLLELLGSVMTPRQVRQAYWMVALLCCLSAVEVIGLGAVLPFIAGLANPTLVRSRLHLDPFLFAMGLASDRRFQIFSGVVLVLVFTIKNVAAGFGQYLQFRWSYRIAMDMSNRLLRRYLSHEYRYFLDVNAQILLKNVGSETWTAVSGVLLPLLSIVSDVMVGVLLYTALVWANYRLTLVASLVFGIFGLIVFGPGKRRMQRVGERRERSFGSVYQDLANAFTGVKVIKVTESEPYFTERVARHWDTYTRGVIYFNSMGGVPKLALETLAVVGLVATMMTLLLQGGRHFVDIVPLLSLYAVAVYRFMPSATRIMTSEMSIRFNLRALEVVSAALTSDAHVPPPAPAEGRAVPFTQSIAFRNVTFRYNQHQAENTIDDVTLRIQKGQTIGIVGASGCGKTTLVDILLGLLVPEDGAVTVDDRPLTRADMPAWHAHIGYIPQDSFVYDETLLRNVAFGVPDDRIDRRLVDDAIRAAQLDEVVARMPDGLETMLGDRGVRLSGGQRQRVGIARALYRDPEILVFDEATSSLDTVTEQEVTKAIEWLGGRKTIVIIAHRLTTVQRCDVIYVMDKGRIIASGSYEQLLSRSADFQRLALGVA